MVGRVNKNIIIFIAIIAIVEIIIPAISFLSNKEKETIESSSVYSFNNFSPGTKIEILQKKTRTSEIKSNSLIINSRKEILDSENILSAVSYRIIKDDRWINLDLQKGDFKLTASITGLAKNDQVAWDRSAFVPVDWAGRFTFSQILQNNEFCLYFKTDREFSICYTKEPGEII